MPRFIDVEEEEKFEGIVGKLNNHKSVSSSDLAFLLKIKNRAEFDLEFCNDLLVDAMKGVDTNDK